MLLSGLNLFRITFRFFLIIGFLARCGETGGCSSPDSVVTPSEKTFKDKLKDIKEKKERDKRYKEWSKGNEIFSDFTTEDWNEWCKKEK